MEQDIRKYALHNALKFEGKANPGSVIGQLFSNNPELKKKAGEVSKKVQEIVTKVNKMSLEEQKKELKKIAPELLEEKKPKEKRTELKELDDISRKIIMRFAPSPSGPMHIGHAMTGGLTSLYCKKYNGKFILRIEDTNSDNIDLDAYKMIPEEAEWIFGNVSEVWIQSDRMQIYYDYARKLIEMNSCYVCTCSQEEFREYVTKTLNCPCRSLSVKEQIERWERMFDKKKGFKEGEAVLRFKSGMQDNNPAMRDFPLVRINDSKHPRQGMKYRVWPLMNLCVTVDDIEAGMTHIIRAKDHMDNAKRQEKIYQALGKKFPHTYFVGRYNFEGIEISCSKTKEKIKKGEFKGWDDVRLPFLAALKRRGIQPEALLRFTKEVGLSQVDKKMDGADYFKIIYSYNREIIDPIAKRFFFVKGNCKIKIENEVKKIEVPLHPESKKLGMKKIKIGKEFYIHDVIKKNEIYRFMHIFNFKNNEFISEKYDQKLGAKIIHAVPVEDAVNVQVLMDNGEIIKGKGEGALRDLKEGEIIQFERQFFARLDDKKKMLFVYAHD